jgi:hypothetical protein
MAELRGLHAPLAAFLHIIDTSRLLTVVKADKRAIFTAASNVAEAAAYLHAESIGSAPCARSRVHFGCLGMSPKRAAWSFRVLDTVLQSE